MKRIYVTALGIGVVCLGLAMVLTAVVPSTTFGADTIKIGLLTPMSGPASIAGKVNTASLTFAVEEQNAKGGLLGKKIELLVEDSEIKVDVGLRKAKKLILEDKVTFLGTGADDALAIALNKLIPEYKVIQLQSTTAAIDLTGKEFSPYTFRNYPSVYSICAAKVELAKAKGFKRFYNFGLDIIPGHDEIKIWNNLVKTQHPGAQIVGEDFFPFNTKDFGPYITKMKAANPDFIQLAAFGPDVVNVIKQSHKMGLKAPFCTHFGLDPQLVRALGPDADGLYAVNAYDMGIKTPENVAFVKRWYEKHKNEKDFFVWWPHPEVGHVVWGWTMAFAAVEKAGSLDPEKIIRTYEDFEYKAPVGVWKMRKCDHQVVRPMFGQLVQCGPNPYFDGTRDPDVKFCYETTQPLAFLPEKVTVPPTPEYNPRCK